VSICSVLKCYYYGPTPRLKPAVFRCVNLFRSEMLLLQRNCHRSLPRNGCVNLFRSEMLLLQSQRPCTTRCHRSVNLFRSEMLLLLTYLYCVSLVITSVNLFRSEMLLLRALQREFADRAILCQSVPF